MTFLQLISCCFNDPFAQFDVGSIYDVFLVSVAYSADMASGFSEQAVEQLGTSGVFLLGGLSFLIAPATRNCIHKVIFLEAEHYHLLYDTSSSI